MPVGDKRVPGLDSKLAWEDKAVGIQVDIPDGTRVDIPAAGTQAGILVQAHILVLVHKPAYTEAHIGEYKHLPLKP